MSIAVIWSEAVSFLITFTQNQMPWYLTNYDEIICTNLCLSVHKHTHKLGVCVCLDIVHNAKNDHSLIHQPLNVQYTHNTAPFRWWRGCPLSRVVDNVILSPYDNTLVLLLRAPTAAFLSFSVHIMYIRVQVCVNAPASTCQFCESVGSDVEYIALITCCSATAATAAVYCVHSTTPTLQWSVCHRDDDSGSGTANFTNLSREKQPIKLSWPTVSTRSQNGRRSA